MAHFLQQRFIYALISARARGLVIGVNLNPKQGCNFNCVYCEVTRGLSLPEERVAVDVMAAELSQTLSLVHSDRLRLQPELVGMEPDLLTLRHVAISGNGEPTLCPNFMEALEAMLHIRARGLFPLFKIVLLTNGTRLDLPQVLKPLKLLTSQDEIWVKLEAGTRQHFETINQPDREYSLEKVLANILMLGQQRAIVIQSLFPAVCGRGPSATEIEQYILRLKELKAAGAQIKLVQVYSANRPAAVPDCGHLPLGVLARIAKSVRQETGLAVEFY